MDRNIFVINAGSTSIKVSLISMPREKKLLCFTANAVGLEICDLEERLLSEVDANVGSNEIVSHKKMEFADHEAILKFIVSRIAFHKFEMNDNAYFGHRFVSGGAFFTSSVVYNHQLDEKLKQIEILAPLHNPINFKVLQIIRRLMPKSRHVLVFDTSFHTTMPSENYIFPIPYSYYADNAIRKYGAHGTSYRFILKTLSNILGMEKINIIAAHVGGGVSICAIKNGKSLNTSMGLTPLGGAMMASRCGDIDPSVMAAVACIDKCTIAEVVERLNKEAGIVGITSEKKCSDFRYLIKEAREKNKRARLALAMFTQRIIDYIGQYYFQLHGDVHAIVLTGGIGENSLEFRNIVFNTVGKVLGIKLNNEIANEKCKSFLILNEKKGFPLLCVMRTNEELIIARDTNILLGQQ